MKREKAWKHDMPQSEDITEWHDIERGPGNISKRVKQQQYNMSVNTEYMII